MTKAKFQKKLEELEREADRSGCCIIPAHPLDVPEESPAAAAPSAAKRRPASGN